MLRATDNGWCDLAGWKDKHDLWVERSTLEELPPEDVLALAQRSRLLTDAEQEKLRKKEEKLRKAKEVRISCA